MTTASVAWRPTASRARLAARAALLAETRAFFAARHVLEVETPLLLPALLPEPHVEPVTAALPLPGRARPLPLFLPPSPEGAMKRLLAAGSGPIYQIARAFRADPPGPLHNPEFTLLEWYRPGWGMAQLMAETAELALTLLGHPQPQVVLTFAEAFQRFAGVDPFHPAYADAAALEAHCQSIGLVPPRDLGWDELLDLLLVERVEAGLQALGGVVFLTHFPPSRAALARIDPGPPATALRFEMYLQGVELANGYQELTDAREQEERFLGQNRIRQAQGLPPLPVDQALLAALHAGLPECAGVAMGLDRLLMLATGADTLAEVLAFPFE